MNGRFRFMGSIKTGDRSGLIGLRGVGALALVLALTALHSYPAVAAESVEELLEAGQKLMANGRYRMALSKFEAADRQAGGRSTAALAMAASAAGELSKWDRMRELGERLVEQADGPVERALGSQAIGYAMWRDSPRRANEARPYLEAAVETAPELSAISFLALSEMDEKAGRLESSAELLGQAIAQGVRPDLSSPLTVRLWRAMDPSDFAKSCRSGYVNRQVKVFDLTGSEVPLRTLRGPGRTESALAGNSVTPPVRLGSTPVRFPESKRIRVTRREKVTVHAIILRNGRVACPQALGEPPVEFAEEAIRAISQWTFEPARLGGQTVTVYYNLTVVFRR